MSSSPTTHPPVHPPHPVAAALPLAAPDPAAAAGTGPTRRIRHDPHRPRRARTVGPPRTSGRNSADACGVNIIFLPRPDPVPLPRVVGMTTEGRGMGSARASGINVTPLSCHIRT